MNNCLKYLVLLLFIPFSLIAESDYPEWEKIELNMDSLSLYGQIEKNSKDELLILLPTGIFQFNENENSWKKLNTPDSLIFDNTLFQTNGSTIYTYGYVHNASMSRTIYFLYSVDYGKNWQIIPLNELKFAGYDTSIFLFVDKSGTICGISSNKNSDPTSKLVVNKFNIQTKTTSKMYEIPKSYQKLLIQEDFVVLLEMISKPDRNDSTSEMREMLIHYSTNGTKWDSIAFNKYNTDDFEKVEGNFSFFTHIFVSKRNIYTYIGPSNSTSLSLIKIDLNNNKLSVLQEKAHISTKLKKVNDTCFFKSELHHSEHWLHSIYKSNDMINWTLFASPFEISDIPDSLEYIQSEFYTTGHWYIDKNENHYLFNNFGLLNISASDKSFKLINRDGLNYVNVRNFAVNSKSDIILLNRNFNENLIIINPDKSSKDIINHRYKMGTSNYFECLPDDSFIFDRYESSIQNFGNFSLDENFTNLKNMKVDDTTNIIFIKHTMSLGSRFLGVTETISDNSKIMGYAISEDFCKTWTKLDDITFREGPVNYSTFCNVNSDIIRADTYGRFYITYNKGKSWITLMNDSTNNLFTTYNESFNVDQTNYNEANGSAIVKYKNRGPIYFSLDHCETWKQIDTNSQAFNFLHNYITKKNSDYSRVQLPVAYDSNYVFYMNTPLGIFRSIDTLKSFHNISKDIIEPSNITNMKPGIDGKLYAINSNAIWRTKKKYATDVNDDYIVNSISDFRISVYPNPASEWLTIELSNQNVLSNFDIFQTLEICNSLGIVLCREMISSYNPVSINISSYPTGVYFIRIGSNLKSFIKN